MGRHAPRGSPARSDTQPPHALYGSGISYFTGKLEMYVRVRGIRYRALPLTAGRTASAIASAVGSSQMPALRLADGRWMSDSTAIIDWFEREHPAGGLLPADPALRFLSLLLEDYADEWLWRPAMHYRGYYPSVRASPRSISPSRLPPGRQRRCGSGGC